MKNFLHNRAEHVAKDYFKDDPDWLARQQQEYPNRSPLNWILFKIHTHGELVDDDEIVYREEDIIELLKKIGFETKWGDEG